MILKPKQYETQASFVRRAMNNAFLIDKYRDKETRFNIVRKLWNSNFNPRQ